MRRRRSVGGWRRTALAALSVSPLLFQSSGCVSYETLASALADSVALTLSSAFQAVLSGALSSVLGG